ncbi:receptor-like protein 33 [Rhododendron vialii]|uniref:receptor-like protein 33 n=1 Tax=Rhododendron vialii TaxID=182163 RepID=UPI00265D6F33|nr:receptor-like protein 33 [Rhododendron vialii]
MEPKRLNRFQSDASGCIAKWVGQSCCKWDGISCDNTTGRVTEINVPGFITCDDAPLQTTMEDRSSTSLIIIHRTTARKYRGKIPVSVANLTVISSMYANTLEGAIPFPTSCCQISSLRLLWLHNNCLTRKINQTFGCLTSLQRVSLSTNKLEGTIPSCLGNLSSLSEMYLSRNQLSSRIPRAIGKLSQLLVFNASHNMIQAPLSREISSL